MKYLLSFLFAITLFSSIYAQEPPTVDGSFLYSGVVELESTVKKDEAYRRAKAWVVETFNSAKTVIDYEDKEEGKIVVKGLIKYNAPAFSPGTNYDGHFGFSLTIWVKDAKFKYELGHLKLTCSNSKYSIEPLHIKPSGWVTTGGAWKKIKSDADSEFRRVIGLLESGIKSPKNKKNDDW